MSLVFAAIIPHPPIILKSIGRDHTHHLERTIASYKKISTALTEAAPDTILVISPHLKIMPGAFVINYAPKYLTNFLSFGDFSPVRSYPTDSLLVERIRHETRKAKMKIVTVSDEHLDYGSGIPLKLIPSSNINPSVVVVSPTMDGPKAQYAFGRVLKEAVMSSNRRVAVFCSGDLSHRLTSDTPSGFSPKGKDFNDLLITNLLSGSVSSVLQMKKELVEEAHACAYSPICILLGIIERMNYTPELLSNESPFGVGYMTMQFHLR